MKIITCITVLLIALLSAAQSDLDFDMEATNGTIGDYSYITYTITNLSQNTISNITIDHAEAVIMNVRLNPSSLAPGASAIASGRVAISGNRVPGGIPLFGFIAAATATGIMNGSTITELSDGINFQGIRVDDQGSSFFITEPQNYGVIYRDVDLDNNYTPGIDATIPGAIINAADSSNNSLTISTNETGWWLFPPNAIESDYVAVIDQNSFPASAINYQLTDGIVPFSFTFSLAFQFLQQHGYTDGTTNFGLLRATAFLDENNNGSRDPAEIDMPYTNFEFIANNDPTTSTIINNGTGVPVLKSDLHPGVQLNDINATLRRFHSFFNINTLNYNDVLTTNGSTTELGFAVTETSPSNRDAALHLVNFTAPNPGFDSTLSLVIENTLNGTATGILQFNNDSRAALLSVKDQAGTDLLLNGTATLNTSGFSLPYTIASFDQKRLVIAMSTPVTGVQMGDRFTHTASINPSSIDNDANNNNKTLDVDVVASYDPNDVTEIRGETIPINTFSNTDYLEYTIRFQNLGTASAQFVSVLSDLDVRLDTSTFEMITTSHDYTYERDGSSLDFFFDNIQLPAEITDEDGSNGFIRYRIKPLPGLGAGDIIAVRASIFFDYNAPVITATWVTTFVIPASINDYNLGAVYPIPLTGNLLFFENIDSGNAQLYSLDGKEIWNGNIGNGQLNLEGIDSGLYILKVISDQNITTIKVSKKSD